jgi:hypothetical protein
MYTIHADKQHCSVCQCKGLFNHKYQASNTAAWLIQLEKKYYQEAPCLDTLHCVISHLLAKRLEVKHQVCVGCCTFWLKEPHQETTL